MKNALILIWVTIAFGAYLSVYLIPKLMGRIF